MADDWLGLITAGALWTPLCDESNFESSVDSLQEQIRKTAPALTIAEPEAQSAASAGDATHAKQMDDLRQQIDELRRQVLVSTPAAPVSKKEHDKNALAPVPADVPPLADNFQSTPDMETLKTLLLDDVSTSVAVSSLARGRIGAFGMGGIGKTVMAAWIARDPDIRKSYDLIIWLTLSSTPNVSKLHSLMHKQITGMELPDDMSSEDAKQTLTKVLGKTKTLLVLDDVSFPFSSSPPPGAQYRPYKNACSAILSLVRPPLHAASATGLGSGNGRRVQYLHR